MQRKDCGCISPLSESAPLADNSCIFLPNKGNALFRVISLHTMLKNPLLLFFCCIVIASCKNPPPAEPAPAPVSEYEQIPVIQNLTKQLEVDNDNPDLYYERAVAYSQLGNSTNALSDVAKALQFDSTNAEYYVLLGEIYFTKQEYTRALNALGKGYSIAPDDTALLLLYAKYALMMGEREKSIKLLDEALKKNMFNTQAYFLKGLVFKEIGDTAKAISNFQTAVEQNPRYYEAYMQLGLLFSKKKNKLALDYFNNALKIDSSSYEAKYAIAMHHQEMKEYDKALELYRQFILNFPQDKEAYFNTGYIYLQIDSIEKATRSFERAIGVAPDYADAYYMRGLCAEVVKDFKNAKFFYQQTLNLNPEHKLASDGIQRLANS